MLMERDSEAKALEDPSYETQRLYTLFGKPGLGNGMLIVIAVYLLSSVAVAAVGQIIA